MKYLVSIVLALFAIGCPAVNSQSPLPNVGFQLLDAGRASITVDGKVWLQSGDVWFHSNNNYYSVSNNSLKLTSTANTPGHDVLGDYQSIVLSWTTPDSQLFETGYKVYTDLHKSIPYIVFTQRWVSGSLSTSTGDVDGVASSFPTFDPLSSEMSLGAYQWGEIFDTSKGFVWSGDNAKFDAYRGRAAGPLVLFSSDSPSTVSILSTFSQFMSTSLAPVNGKLSVGVVGSISELPPGFFSESILVFGAAGVTQSVIEWGDVLLTRYMKDRQAAWTDTTTRYLGYNTDNGAFYYYNTEPNMNYEQTLLKVMEYAKSLEIPYKGMLLDSWWYFKGAADGVKNWTAMPTIFPSGLDSFNEATKLNYIAHNRWWAPETDYAKQNGGSYDWLIDGNWSLPLEQRFWSDLISNNTQWGLRTYEQDWLCTVYDNFKPIQTDANLGRAWLHQMGSGAERAGVNIQYCMPYPRHLMQSVEIPNVVQVRASTDNVPGTLPNLLIGESDLFAFALGVAPFKDGFWTTPVQDGNPYHGKEPSPALNAAIATLSAGPVFPGDKIGATNVSLLSRSYRADGLILKPDRPAFSLDASYFQRAYPTTDGPNARQITHAFSRFSTALWWHYLLVLEESHAYSLTLDDLHLPASSKYLAYYWHGGRNNFDDLREFSSSAPLALEPNLAEDNFTVWQFAPVLSNGLAVLGDTTKWAAMSKQRFSNVDVKPSQVDIEIIGDQNEIVNVKFAQQATKNANWQITAANCRIGPDGTSTLTILVDAKGENQWACRYY